MVLVILFIFHFSLGDFFFFFLRGVWGQLINLIKCVYFVYWECAVISINLLGFPGPLCEQYTN